MMSVPRVRRLKSRALPPILAKYLPAKEPMLPAKARNKRSPKRAQLDPRVKTVENLKGEVVFVGTEAQWRKAVKERKRDGWIYTPEGWVQ